MSTSEMVPGREAPGRAALGSAAQFLAGVNWREPAQTLTITLGAIAVSMALFGLYMLAFYRVSPLDLYYFMYRGSFGSSVSIQSSLLAAAPLILVALCTALPARI